MLERPTIEQTLVPVFLPLDARGVKKVTVVFDRNGAREDFSTSHTSSNKGAHGKDIVRSSRFLRLLVVSGTNACGDR